ncbi:MAG: cupredoxin domain-containing protein [Parcubacteria group bacterium]|nr:cupredoxin domain-containing protein [Parcubacteria group bacterium]
MNKLLLKKTAKHIVSGLVASGLLFSLAVFAQDKKSERFNAEGPVIAVDTAAKTLTITLEKARMALKDSQGKDQAISVTDETRIRMRDVDIGLGEIVVGSKSKIKGRKVDEKFVADKIDLKVEEFEIKGEIKLIDAASRTIKVLAEKAKKLEDVEGKEIDVKVLENAKITKADEKIGFDALKVGDKVNLKISQIGDKYIASKVVVTAAKAEKIKRGEPGITNFEVEENARTGKKFKVSWRVSGPKGTVINHTAVHYGTESKQGDFGLDKTPADAGYPGLTSDFASGSFKIPKKFKADIVAPNTESTLYMRAHVIIDGKHYWTAEKSVKVVLKKEEEVKKEEKKEATISIAASGFSPSNVEVAKGGKIEWKNNDTVDHQPASAPHPFHTDWPSLGNGQVLKPGEDFSITASEIGTFQFHDHLNPVSPFFGSITVK